MPHVPLCVQLCIIPVAQFLNWVTHMFLCVCSYYTCGTVPELNAAYVPLCVHFAAIMPVPQFLNWMPHMFLCVCSYYTCATVPELSDSYVPLCVQLLYLCHSSWTYVPLCAALFAPTRAGRCARWSHVRSASPPVQPPPGKPWIAQKASLTRFSRAANG